MTDEAHSMGTPANREAFLGVALSLMAAIGFSAKAIFVKLAYLEQVDAVTLLALRMAFAVPFFIGVAVWARYRHAAPLGRHDRLLVVGLGLLGYYLSSLFDFLGLQYITAGLERLILFLYPTITVILIALIYKRPVGGKTLAAMALCYFGIALVFLHDAEAAQGRSVVLGTALVFASTLTYSAYLVGAGHAIRRIGASRFTAYAMVVASIAALLQFVLTRPVAVLELPVRVYGLALGMAVLSTVLPVFLLAWSIRRIGSGNASLIGAVGPISTIFLAYLLLGENLGSVQVIGSALVLAGVAIVSFTTRTRENSAPR